MEKGFTLIETIIYAALVSIIIIFSVLVMYQIIEVQDRLKAKAEIEGEAGFVLQKINWVLGGAYSINQPSAGATSTTLSINKSNFPQNPLVFDAANGNVRLSRAGGNAIILDNQNVVVDNLIFEHLAASGNVPPAVKIAIRVSYSFYSKTFETIYYLRK